MGLASPQCQGSKRSAKSRIDRIDPVVAFISISFAVCLLCSTSAAQLLCVACRVVALLLFPRKVFETECRAGISPRPRAGQWGFGSSSIQPLSRLRFRFKPPWRARRSWVRIGSVCVLALIIRTGTRNKIVFCRVSQSGGSQGLVISDE